MLDHHSRCNARQATPSWAATLSPSVPSRSDRVIRCVNLLCLVFIPAGARIGLFKAQSVGNIAAAVELNLNDCICAPTPPLWKHGMTHQTVQVHHLTINTVKKQDCIRESVQPAGRQIIARYLFLYIIIDFDTRDAADSLLVV